LCIFFVLVEFVGAQCLFGCAGFGGLGGQQLAGLLLLLCECGRGFGLGALVAALVDPPDTQEYAGHQSDQQGQHCTDFE
jgi:hypothetical protein